MSLYTFDIILIIANICVLKFMTCPPEMAVGVWFLHGDSRNECIFSGFMGNESLRETNKSHENQKNKTLIPYIYNVSNKDHF